MIRLKELRLEKGMNMRQTAIALNIPYTTYISYEKAEREPNSETLIMLADYFNCSIDYLIGRTDERIDDNLLDRALEVDNDLLEKYGNIYEAKNAQEARDNSQTLPDLINNTPPTVESNATMLPDSNVRMIKEILSMLKSRLFKLMYEYKMTQKQLAESIGASQSNVSDWLNGKTLPSVEKLVAIADSFETTIDYLLGRSDVENPAADTAQRLTDTARGRLYDELNQLSESDYDELLLFARFLRYKHGLSKS